MAYATALVSFPVLLSALFSIWIFSFAGETYSRGNEAAMVWIPSVIGALLLGLAAWHSGPYASFAKAYARIGLFALLS